MFNDISRFLARHKNHNPYIPPRVLHIQMLFGMLVLPFLANIAFLILNSTLQPYILEYAEATNNLNVITYYEPIVQLVMYAVFLGVAVYIFRHHLRLIFETFSLKRFYFSYIVGILGCAVIFGGGYLLNLLYDLILNNVGTNENQISVEVLITSAPLISFFTVVIIAPIYEELIYRVAVFGYLSQRLRKVYAYLIAISIFAIIHISLPSSGFTWGYFVNELASLPHYLLAAFILTTCYDYGGMPASLTAHVLNNLISFLMTTAILRF
jgi:membrane protease YdiL (CAAX protease family)